MTNLIEEACRYQVSGLRRDGDFHLASGAEIPVTRMYTAHSVEEARKKAEEDGLFGSRTLGLEIKKVK
jgi:hypothetical protein